MAPLPSAKHEIAANCSLKDKCPSHPCLTQHAHLRVRHQQQDALPVFERVLQPHACLQVQVVGGLHILGCR